MLKTTPGTNPSGARAEFWKLRGLRGAKKTLRKSREDLSALTKQGHYPPYERVVLKEGGYRAAWTHPGSSALGLPQPSPPELLCLLPTASFKRPVVILGPITDIAMQKLSMEQPELFEIARKYPPQWG